ncbi:MAG: hypothetical protein ABJB69_10925 [Spartobacteria bacterium]
MKKTAVCLLAFAAITSVALAGTEYSGKEMKQTRAVAPEECFYGDSEWNVSLWGTYAFAGTDSNSVGAPEFALGLDHGDRYLETDHAWGGGIDAKYFWHKYFGFGVEGFVLDAKRTRFNFEPVPVLERSIFTKEEDRRAIGSALGTFTFRFPIGCSRFAPYVFAGAGAIFNGGEKDRPVVNPTTALLETRHSDSETKALGQFGGGLEVRITRHIGWINDFSWNVVDGAHNNFGMVRSGLNFAF